MIVKVAYYTEKGKRQYIKGYTANGNGNIQTCLSPDEARIIKNPETIANLGRALHKKGFVIKEQYYNREEKKKDPKNGVDLGQGDDETKIVIIQSKDGVVLALYDEESIDAALADFEKTISESEDKKEISSAKKQAQILMKAKKQLAAENTLKSD